MGNYKKKRSFGLSPQKIKQTGGNWEERKEAVQTLCTISGGTVGTSWDLQGAIGKLCGDMEEALGTSDQTTGELQMNYR